MKLQLCDVYGKKVWIPLQESKTYIKDPSQAPPGASVKTGPHGGHYYDSDGNSQQPQDTETKEIGNKIPKTNSIKSHFQQIMDMTNNPRQRKYYGEMINSMEPRQKQKLTDEEMNYVESLYKEMRMKPKMKDCFMNAQKLALQSGGKIKYVEGSYLFPDLIPIPFDHAWCSINGKDFDPTQLFNGKDKENTQYFGREFSDKEVRENMLKTKMYTSVSRNKISDAVENKMKVLYDIPKIDNAIKKAVNEIPKDKKKKIEENFQKFKEGNHTKNIHTDENGNYTEERKELHKQIINKMLANGMPSNSPSIVFSAGLPGSGKSYTLRSMGDKYLDHITISGDDIKEHLPEFDGGDGSQLVHDEAKDISKQIMKKALEEKYSIILDGTMKSYDKALKKVQGAKEKGYTTFLLGIELPTHKSIERAAKRFKEKGRYMPYEVIKDVAQQIYQSIEMLKTTTDNYKVYNTDVGFGEKPIRVEKMTEQNNNDNMEFDNKMSKAYLDMASDYEEMIDDVLISKLQND